MPAIAFSQHAQASSVFSCAHLQPKLPHTPSSTPLEELRETLSMEPELSWTQLCKLPSFLGLHDRER
jgi:hypothetical protein